MIRRLLTEQNTLDDDVTFNGNSISQIGGHAMLKFLQFNSVDKDFEIIRIEAHPQCEIAVRTEWILGAVDPLLFRPAAALGVEHDDALQALKSRIHVQGNYLTSIGFCALLQVDEKSMSVRFDSSLDFDLASEVQRTTDRLGEWNNLRVKRKILFN